MTTTTRKKKPSDDVLREAVLKAALPHIGFDGYTDKVLSRAAAEVDVDESALARLFPEGPLGLASYFSSWADRQMEKRLAKRDLKSMKVRERITLAVKTRIEVVEQYKEAARRTAAFLTLPPNVGAGAKLLWRTADAIWRVCGDTSTDFNFYSKRAILSGVFSSTLMRWFTDTTEDGKETDEFLRARIENVMQIEQMKARLKETLKHVPSLSDFWSGLGPKRP